jgi:hypothetical protein
MFLESSFFPAFQNLFLGVLRALSDQRERAVRFFIRRIKHFFALEKVSTSIFEKMNHPNNWQQNASRISSTGQCPGGERYAFLTRRFVFSRVAHLHG